MKPTRIAGFTLFYRVFGAPTFKEVNIKSNTAFTYVLQELEPATKYQLKIRAVNAQYLSPESDIVDVKTKNKRK